MTVGMMMICAGAAVMGIAFLMTMITAITAPSKKRNMELRMREKYANEKV